MLNETRRRTRRPVEKKFAGTALAEWNQIENTHVAS